MLLPLPWSPPESSHPPLLSIPHLSLKAGPTFCPMTAVLSDFWGCSLSVGTPHTFFKSHFTCICLSNKVFSPWGAGTLIMSRNPDGTVSPSHSQLAWVEVVPSPQYYRVIQTQITEETTPRELSCIPPYQTADETYKIFSPFLFYCVTHGQPWHFTVLQLIHRSHSETVQSIVTSNQGTTGSHRPAWKRVLSVE